MHWLASVPLGALLGACVYGSVRPPEKPARVSPREIAPLSWRPVGSSVQGRPIQRCVVGTGARQVLFIGGIHGDETEGVEVTAQLPAAFINSPGLASQVTLHIVEDMNPDGRRASTRTNSRGVDLNRDFPASNRRQGHGLGEPESRAIHDLIRHLRPDLVIVAHSWRKRCFINYDGPARRIAQVFSKHSGFPVVPSSNIGATPGSLGSWCGWDLGIPILTIEWLRGTAPKEAWRATRVALLETIRGALTL